MCRRSEYFILSGQSGNPIPRLESWYGRLDVRKLTREAYRELPDRVMQNMKTGTDILYPDILFAPFLLVSREAMNVIWMYEEEMPFIFAALFDTDKGESASYYIPILAEKEECGEALYRVKKRDGWEVRIRLDLAESLLRRGAEGMELSETAVT